MHQALKRAGALVETNEDALRDPPWLRQEVPGGNGQRDASRRLVPQSFGHQSAHPAFPARREEEWASNAWPAYVPAQQPASPFARLAAGGAQTQRRTVYPRVRQIPERQLVCGR